MFTLLPQLVLILAIVALIMILLRRLPQVTVREEETEIQAAPAPKSPRDQVAEFLQRLRQTITRFLRKAREFALSAKDQTVKPHYLKRFSEAFHFPHLNRKKSNTGKTADHTEDITKASDFIEGSNLAGAEQIYIKIIANDPSNQEAYEGLGKVYLEQKKYKDAQEVYEYLVKNHPDNDSYMGRLGLVRFNLGKYEEAIEAYNKAIEINPHKPSRIMNLSLCYEAMDELDKAIQTAEKAISVQPDNTKHLMMYVDLFVKKGDVEKATDIVEKVLELDPTNEAARQRLRELKY